MNSNSNESKEKRVLRSFNSENEFIARFVNQTTRNVHLIWIDFKGEEVLYKTLPPNHYFTIKTYLTHPWILREHKRRDKLFFIDKNNNNNNKNNNNKSSLNDVFVGKSADNQIVYIFNGLYTLKERCFQLFFDKMPFIHSFESLEIPKSLINDYHNYINKCKTL
jgi:hypothetical protein